MRFRNTCLVDPYDWANCTNKLTTEIIKIPETLFVPELTNNTDVAVSATQTKEIDTNNDQVILLFLIVLVVLVVMAYLIYTKKLTIPAPKKDSVNFEFLE